MWLYHLFLCVCMCKCVSALGGQKMVMECDGELSFGRVNDEEE